MDILRFVLLSGCRAAARAGDGLWAFAKRVSEGMSMRRKSTLRIAHVGAHKRFTMNDGLVNLLAVQALVRNGVLAESKLKRDIINLVYGRDFLTETIKYDIVILHSIYHTSLLENDEPRPVSVSTSISPLHKLEHWRARLQDTEAQWIVVVEAANLCLSGWQLGNIEGYEMVERDGRVTLYRKK